jgi:uncharacterized protein
MRMMKKERPKRCPACKKPTAWEGNPFRPFCSERCKLLDLGDWATERYRIPTAQGGEEAGGEPAASEEEEGGEGAKR